MAKNPILEQVKAAIRSPYAWPGGYPVYTVMADGELLCAQCARKLYPEIVKATTVIDYYYSGYKAIGAEVLWEGEGVCCHCNKILESAYSEPDNN